MKTALKSLHFQHIMELNNMGTKAASEIFQHVISKRLQGIPGVLNISDDI